MTTPASVARRTAAVLFCGVAVNHLLFVARDPSSVCAIALIMLGTSPWWRGSDVGIGTALLGLLAVPSAVFTLSRCDAPSAGACLDIALDPSMDLLEITAWALLLVALSTIAVADLRRRGYMPSEDGEGRAPVIPPATPRGLDVPGKDEVLEAWDWRTSGDEKDPSSDDDRPVDAGGGVSLPPSGSPPE